jgi:DNA-binding IclR family transcriptional regulator
MPTIASFLLHVITERRQVDNLLRLSSELGLHYHSAHRGLQHLEREGLVNVQRGGYGVRLRITVNIPPQESQSHD